jgi:hypothetical protein
MTTRKNFSLLLIAMALLSGCASLPNTAPSYTPDSAGTPDKATVYVYRSSGFVGGMLSPNVSANGVPLADLPAGGYFVYHAAPGTVELTAHTEAKTSVTVEAKAGESYYIKESIGMGVFAGHPHLELVSADVGAKEIKDCKLVSATIPTAEQVAAGQAQATSAAK